MGPDGFEFRAILILGLGSKKSDEFKFRRMFRLILDSEDSDRFELRTILRLGLSSEELYEFELKRMFRNFGFKRFKWVRVEKHVDSDDLVIRMSR